MSLFSHEFHEDSSDEFGTPVDFHRPIADAVGGFDLDPASGAEPTPLASTRYTEDDDGLTSEWFGTVWLNPPFSEKTRWVRKAVSEVNAGNVDTAVVLLPVDTSTQLFHDFVVDATAICFVESRLSFVGGDRNPNFGILLAVYGDAPDELLDVLDRKGTVFDTTHERAEQQELVTDGGHEQSREETHRVVIAQCTDSKRDGEHSARTLYDESIYFLRQRVYAEAVGDDWFIQSACYGLLRPDDVVESYDKHAKDIEDTEAWASEIADNLTSQVPDDAVVEVLGGKQYADPLTPELEQRGFEVHEPLRGQRIGERRRSLAKMANRKLEEFA